MTYVVLVYNLFACIQARKARAHFDRLWWTHKFQALVWLIPLWTVLPRQENLSNYTGVTRELSTPYTFLTRLRAGKKFPTWSRTRVVISWSLLCPWQKQSIALHPHFSAPSTLLHQVSSETVMKFQGRSIQLNSTCPLLSDPALLSGPEFEHQRRILLILSSFPFLNIVTHW